MKNAASFEIYAYWNRLRHNRSAPSRAEIDPGKIRSILPDLFILKANDAGIAFGLTGTRLYNLFRAELRGSQFEDIWNDRVGGYANDIAKGVMTHQLPVIFEIEGETADGLELVALEMVLLPLAAEQSGQGSLLGCISCEPARNDFAQPLAALTITRSGLLEPPKRRSKSYVPQAGAQTMSKWETL
ncbi:PAS domain-containing protein [Agrobacterium larrymoorei]|uniref:PAS domain-containing protein n=1 Tax=Agrobacterium larrymoorei TaxID=160699 RepID=UPI0015718124|nr:PAS domain-containing protein [Agrobacterium larrymoorei]NTJ42424.1 PAS domain-containing protein [Agrobacterium larrymoorei]